MQTLVYTKRAFLWGCAETNGSKDNGRVQTKPVESDLDGLCQHWPTKQNGRTDIEGEPRICGTKEDLAVLPLAKVCEEVTARGLGGLHALDSRFIIDVKLASCDNVLDILSGLPDIAVDIHGKTRSFRDSESEIQGNATGDTSQPNKQTPAVVYVFEHGKIVVDDLGFERIDQNK